MKKNRTRKFSLEVRAAAGRQERKEKGFVAESEPAASSKLFEERKPAISKLIKCIALLCFIYNLKVRSLVEEHELVLQKNLTGKIDHVLPDSAYDVRRDRRDVHAA